MKRFITAVAVTVAVFALTACNAKTENSNISEEAESLIESAPVSIPTVETQLAEEEELTRETQYGNTTGNISNDAFAAQDGNCVYFFLPTHIGTDARLGDLIKENADDSVAIVSFYSGRPSCLNVVDGWIYYISSPDGLIYKMRGDGTESTLITSADTQSGFQQGYTTQDLSMVEKIVVVDDYIYCRAYNNDSTKGIYRINIESGEVEHLQQLGEITSGFAVYDGWIYYSISDGDTWETYRIRTDGTENTMIADFLIFLLV